MKLNYKVLLALLMTVSLTGCFNFTTRVERDLYTITERDTTTFIEQKNAPGNRDNGVIFPSSRTIESYRDMQQRDSLVQHEYPDFIRLSIFESVGTVGGNNNYSTGSGLFGIFPNYQKLSSSNRGDSSSLFTGGIYRIGTGDWRLRWFRDAKDWTLGTSLFEGIFPDARVENSLVSILPLYVKKRWYITDKIPYLTVTASVGVGWFPSQYINLSGSLDLGSMGGLNLRAYLGVAAGVNTKNSYMVRLSPIGTDATTVFAPYAGLGISFLDFSNSVPETYVEWKNHPNSSWDVGILQLSFLYTGTDSSAISSGTGKSLFNGVMIKGLNTNISLPFADNKFYFGASLFNLMALGMNEWALGILPIRVGYWMTLLPDELSLDPYIETSFYPSAMYNFAVRMNLRLSKYLNGGLIAGYLISSTNYNLGSDLTSAFGNPGSISRFYFGFSVGIGDKIFYPENIRYNQ
jgi:hypothetical protein